MSDSTHGVLILVLLLASGCSPVLPSRVPFARSPEGGQAAGAALYQLGLSQADPTRSVRDYRAARATFTRLLIDNEGRQSRSFGSAVYRPRGSWPTSIVARSPAQIATVYASHSVTVSPPVAPREYGL